MSSCFRTNVPHYMASSLREFQEGKKDCWLRYGWTNSRGKLNTALRRLSGSQ